MAPARACGDPRLIPAPRAPGHFAFCLTVITTTIHFKMRIWWALWILLVSVLYVYEEKNEATLTTGAIDVIVVGKPDGELACAPFHVRFGKADVLWSNKKLVNITINDIAVSIQMKLSGTGEAFFVENIDGSYTKTLTNEQLKSLKLRRGVPNKARFMVATKYRGTIVCECDIWLWHHTDKIVISDIDSTITRSDLKGQIIPLLIGISRDHPGVAELFQRIAANDYKIFYLSIRSIGMAKRTKNYSQSLQQDQFALPDGPLLVSPMSMLTSFYWVVIAQQAAIIKTKCLRELVSLFPCNPFYAGFGNLPSDVAAYTDAGVPRIFVIDPSGAIELLDSEVMLYSFLELVDLVDDLFPPEYTFLRFLRSLYHTTLVSSIDLREFFKSVMAKDKASISNSIIGAKVKTKKRRLYHVS